jgi:hypothetical protein
MLLTRFSRSFLVFAFALAVGGCSRGDKAGADASAPEAVAATASASATASAPAAASTAAPTASVATSTNPKLAATKCKTGLVAVMQGIAPWCVKTCKTNAECSSGPCLKNACSSDEGEAPLGSPAASATHATNAASAASSAGKPPLPKCGAGLQLVAEDDTSAPYCAKGCSADADCKPTKCNAQAFSVDAKTGDVFTGVGKSFPVCAKK